ncbi:MAG: molecular chaperone DnaK [Magnetococcales bacterium]|nr:molecular chaperone DnaK [Magnetococcales bacterium]
MSRIIGIDLGTTNSCVAVVENGDVVVLANQEGGRTTPSMVAYTAEGERRVGQTAKRQMVVNPENTLFAIKRLMGRRFADPIIRRETGLLAYPVVELPSGDVGVKVWDEIMTPAEVSAIILQKMKRIAEENLDETVRDAVITVPAYFTEAQRQATRDAGRIAGLNVLRIINEPTAAALAYGLHKSENKTIAVFDLGGGTFDISILEIGDGVFQVKATNGDTFLGGEDFDRCLIHHLADTFMAEHGIDPRLEKESLQRLKEAAEIARIELSSSLRTEIHLPFLCFDEKGPKNLQMTLTRARLEELVDSLIQRTIIPCVIALKDAGLGVEQIDEVILAGGMTRMPKIRQTVAKFFNREPRAGVNPDEIVAMGAAIQAAVLGGEIRNVLLLDVTPLSLGIETKGGLFNVLIPKNEPIPCRFTKTFSTVMDLQKFATVRVAQGERGIFAANHFLGEFTLDGLPPAPRGVPRIEVSFVVDADGMVKAAAIDKSTGQEQSIRVQVSGGLTEADIQRMIREAEQHAEADARQQRLVQLLDRADGILYRVKQFLLFHDKALETDTRERLQDGMRQLRRTMESNPEFSRLDQETRALAEALAQSPIPCAAPEPDPAEAGDSIERTTPERRSPTTLSASVRESETENPERSEASWVVFPADAALDAEFETISAQEEDPTGDGEAALDAARFAVPMDLDLEAMFHLGELVDDEPETMDNHSQERRDARSRNESVTRERLNGLIPPGHPLTGGTAGREPSAQSTWMGRAGG